ncbi:MAG: D-arabinono-1,4-lactone oxidase, partial [Mycetocola sp.]
MTSAVERWTNWAGNHRAEPVRVEQPRSIAELRGAVRAAAAAGTPIKAVGAGHSFSGIAVTEGILLRLDALSGVVSINRERRQATFYAGTPLHRVASALAEVGLALANMGDINVQTIAGAISTGTHGTGLGFGGMATQVVGLSMVTADGELNEFRADDDGDILPLLALGLGAFGVVATVTIQCVPRFVLQATESLQPLESTLDTALEQAEASDHFEFFWFPHTDRVMAKHQTRLPGDAKRRAPSAPARWVNDVLLNNGALAAACAVGSRVPSWVPTINRAATALSGSRELIDYSDRVFASPRLVRFREMEYAVPAESVANAVRAVERVITENNWQISFPVEVRFAQADELWLSTAYRRPSAYIAVHRYLRDDPADYFAAVEEALVALGGRPHWGKMHSRTAA